jgi:hypothetical protein
MITRKWQGDPGCYFCGMPENCGHLFEWHIAKVIEGGGGGGLLPYAFSKTQDLLAMINSGFGLPRHSLGETKCICSGLQLFAGQSGEPEMRSVCLTGQDSIQKTPRS